MIPWVREKFAERRARWIASRKQQQNERINNASKEPKSADNKLEKHNIGSEVDELLPNCSAAGQETSAIELCLISSKSGRTRNVLFPNTATGMDIKMECLRLFGDDFNVSADVLPKNLDNFKLVKARIPFYFDDTKTLQERNICNKDEFLLISSTHNTMASTCTSTAELVAGVGPIQNDIDIATRSLSLPISIQTANSSTTSTSLIPIVNIEELVLQSDVQFDIRQILISLAQSAAYIIGSGPYAKQLIQMFTNRLYCGNKSAKIYDFTSTVQCLVDMGFSRENVLYALDTKNNVYAEALDWLMEHQKTINLEFKSIGSTSLQTKMQNLCTIRENIEALLNIVRIYCEKEIIPSSDAIKLISAMGFDEQDVRKALSLTKNNYIAACDWLIDNENTKLSNFTDGLPFDSPILKALLVSPHVQLSLSCPKMFIAYLSILEDYSSMNMWLGDSETSGVIGHIFRTYHEEKHILAINQFSLEL